MSHLVFICFVKALLLPFVEFRYVFFICLMRSFYLLWNLGPLCYDRDLLRE